MARWKYPEEVHDYAHDGRYQHYLNINRQSLVIDQANLHYLQGLYRAGLTLLPWFLYDEGLGKIFQRGPHTAEKPMIGEHQAYIWPSVIIWQDDESYILEPGMEIKELPRETLRETGGRPHTDRPKSLRPEPWVRSKREFKPLSPLVGQHKWQR